MGCDRGDARPRAEPLRVDLVRRDVRDLRDQRWRWAHQPAHTATADATEPVAELVAEPLQLEALDQRRPRLLVLLVDRAQEALQHRLVGRDLLRVPRELQHLVDVELAGRFERAAELAADEDAVLAADPAADQMAATEEVDLAEDGLELLRVLRAQRLDDGSERLGVLRELPDRLTRLAELEEVLFLRLVFHECPFGRVGHEAAGGHSQGRAARARKKDCSRERGREVSPQHRRLSPFGDLFNRRAKARPIDDLAGGAGAQPMSDQRRSRTLIGIRVGRATGT